MAKDNRKKSGEATGAWQAVLAAGRGLPVDRGGRGEKAAPTAALGHARAPSAPPVVERVRIIVDLMTSGRWSSKMSFQLADEWGVVPTTVQNHSSEASRIVKASYGDPDEIRARLCGVIDDAVELAKLDPNPAAAAKAMTGAAEAWARIMGVSAPNKVAVTDTAGRDVLPPHLAQLAGIRNRELYTRCLIEGRGPTAAELEADKGAE